MLTLSITDGINTKTRSTSSRGFFDTDDNKISRLIQELAKDDPDGFGAALAELEEDDRALGEALLDLRRGSVVTIGAYWLSVN